MKLASLIAVIIISSTSAFAQSGNVGIGTSTPYTTLDVNGGLTLRQDTAYVLSNAATIPSNASQVSLQGFASGAMTITAPTPQSAGQQLTVFNNVYGGQVAKMNGYSIPNGQSLTFRSNGNTPASFLPDANNFVNVRILSSASFVTMLSTDYFVKFTASAFYSLDDAAANTGRVIYIFVAGTGTFPSLGTAGGSFVNTGGTSTSSVLNLTSGSRLMLVSDGTNWVRMY